MSVRTEKRFFIRCDADGCDREHHDPTATSAMEARVSAGRDGWQFQVAKDRGGPGAGRGAVRGRKVHFDRCPECRTA